MANLARGPEDYFSPGDWNFICSICGAKGKASEAEQNWQGFWRHPRCNEPRPAQDFVHSIDSKEMAIPWAQKDSDIDIIAPAFPLSGVAVTNTYTMQIEVYWYSQGANVTSILVAGTPIGVPSKFFVAPGQTISFTYTNGRPMWNWQGTWQ